MHRRSDHSSLRRTKGGKTIAKVVVIGGGPSGMAAVHELVSRGISCIVLERADHVGGRVSELACKGTVHCRHCDVCHAHQLMENVLRSELVTVHTNAEVEQVERNNSRYRFEVRRAKDPVDQGRCSRCGKCAEVCPSGAMVKEGGRIGFDPSECLSLQGMECERCVSVCPTGAIDIFGEDRLSITGDAVIVATGTKVFEAEKDVRLGFGRVPGVITSMDLESFLEGRSRIELSESGKVAFILCVGSRTSREGTSMCSSVCCKYSLRQALTLKERFPGLSITIFIMDWRGIRPGDGLLRELSGTDIKVVRSRPAEIMEEDGGPMVRYAAEGEIFNDPFDLVVLAVGLLPDQDDPTLLDLAIPRDGVGNLVKDGLMEKSIFLAGSCSGPKDIRLCMIDGINAARQVCEWLEGQDE